MAYASGSQQNRKRRGSASIRSTFHSLALVVFRVDPRLRAIRRPGARCSAKWNWSMWLHPYHSLAPAARRSSAHNGEPWLRWSCWRKLAFRQHMAASNFCLVHLPSSRHQLLVIRVLSSGNNADLKQYGHKGRAPGNGPQGALGWVRTEPLQQYLVDWSSVSTQIRQALTGANRHHS